MSKIRALIVLALTAASLLGSALPAGARGNDCRGPVCAYGMVEGQDYTQTQVDSVVSVFAGPGGWGGGYDGMYLDQLIVGSNHGVRRDSPGVNYMCTPDGTCSTVGK